MVPRAWVFQSAEEVSVGGRELEWKASENCRESKFFVRAARSLAAAI